MNFNQRSYQKELLDADDIPADDLYQNLRELDFINTRLGGHHVTARGVSKLVWNKSITYRILDIGSGGGDTLRYIANWGRKNGYKFQLTGVDLKENCINFAERKSRAFPEISFIRSDYRDLLHLEQPFDIMISSLFCHHLTDEQFIELMKWMDQQAKTGFIMNDLHRHPFAYYSIKWLTSLFSKSYLVKNDAALSVQRGFHKKEIEQFLSRAGISSYSLNWHWAFRWLLIVSHADPTPLNESGIIS